MYSTYTPPSPYAPALRSFVLLGFWCRSSTAQTPLYARDGVSTEDFDALEAFSIEATNMEVQQMYRA